MRHLIINPGTERIADASEAEAVANMGELLREVALAECRYFRMAEADHANGRFAFMIWHDRLNDGCLVEMPGLPLARVRYTGAGDQNIWDFPRLYVEGSSWVWSFAVGIVQAYFREEGTVG